ncbi:hypothetical protein STENM223S_03254 [Streptomyces tendae]
MTCADGSSYAFERLIVTTPQPAFAKAAGLPDDSAVWKNQYLGATCFVLELDRSAIPYYWLNINEPDFPFLAVVEHTKMIDPSVYGGRHILYVGNYVEREDLGGSPPIRVSCSTSSCRTSSGSTRPSTGPGSRPGTSRRPSSPNRW